MQLFLLLSMVLVSFSATPSARAQSPTDPKLTKALQDVYAYWRDAMKKKNHAAWKQITASHRQMAIKNRIMSERGRFPQDVFRVPGTPPAAASLKLLRSRYKGMTAKQVYFGKVDFGVGGAPSDNLLVLSFVYESGGWKYDSAEFVNLGGLKDVRTQLMSGNLKYVDGEAFLPDGKVPVKPMEVGMAKYIAKVYTYCPGREVRASVNKISKHRFQNDTRSEVVIGGVRDGMNEIQFWIKDLPGYKGDDPLTVRVYIFPQVEGHKPVKVFQYQTIKGEKPKLTAKEMFNIGPDDVKRIGR
ncbi:hypothetical protein HW115_14555 [Verrucomicrobiaceae bacterium N1E253]|uniref:DUF1571 domain-containing protein n=1 Tax=Oceaniferula marina TaxID=2748318 RepID=A0A851GLY9_9BACT|nr:hypothetical protein [Oceaniferula marina]NWK56841.1 hypothetical protein [Oceaniferula marina]